MRVIKRNQIIVTAFAIMVAIAGYLDYSDTKKNDVNLNSDRFLSEAKYGESTEIFPTDVQMVADANEAGTVVFVDNNLDDTYFSEAKLDREQARAKQKDVLTEMINNANVDKEQKADCANAMLDIQKRIEKETSAEAMIESKDINEAYVNIDDNTVDVVVDQSKLSDAEKDQIEDIVVRKTGIAVENIRISPLKK